MAEAVVKRLVGRKLADVRDETRAREVVRRILIENFQAEEKIDADARTLLMDNAKLIREIRRVPPEKRTARFVCWIAGARDGNTLAVFEGKAEGTIIEEPRGSNGFGYDPLFYFPAIGKSFAELTPQEKAKYSHRGAAFRAFLEWCREYK